MQLLATARNTNNNIIITDEALDVAFLIGIGLHIAVQLKVQAHNPAHEHYLRCGDARLEAHQGEVCIIGNIHVLHDSIVAQDVVHDILAADGNSRYHTGIFLNAGRHFCQIAIDICICLIPLDSRDQLLGPVVKPDGISLDHLAISCIACNLALAVQQNISCHLVLAVHNHVLQISQILGQQLGCPLLRRHAGIDIFTEGAVGNIIRRNHAPRPHHRRLVPVNLGLLPCHVDTAGAGNNKRCQLACSLAIFHANLSGYGCCRNNRKKGINQKR